MSRNTTKRRAAAHIGRAAIGLERAKTPMRTKQRGKATPGTVIATDRLLGGRRAVKARPDTNALNVRAFPVHTTRSGTKQQAIIALLNSSRGASLGELIAATGWLPHTTRAALTGLRRKGFEVTRHAGPEGHGSVYRIVQSNGEGAQSPRIDPLPRVDGSSHFEMPAPPRRTDARCR